MLAVKVQFDEKSFKEAVFLLRAIPRAVPRVFTRAINRAVDSAAVDLKRRVGSILNVRKGDIAKALKKRRASYSNLTGTISAGEFRPGLIAFTGTRQTKRGVTYRIMRTTGRKLLPHGFIQRMSSGHRGVYKRKGISRLPISEQRGPSVWRVITNSKDLLKDATDAAGDKMAKMINQQVGYELRKWNR